MTRTERYDDHEEALNEAFTNWLHELDELTYERTGLSIHDLPEMSFWENFDAGETPADFFDAAVVAELLEMGFEATDFADGAGG